MFPQFTNGTAASRVRDIVSPATSLSGSNRLRTDPGHGAGSPLAVHRLIADLSTRFVTIPTDSIDDAVRESLRLVADALQFDHAILWRADEHNVTIVASHLGSKHPLRPLPDPVVLASMSFMASAARGHEAVWLTRLADLVDPSDRATGVRQGLRSAVVVPVALTGGDDQRGALAFISATTEHEWTPAAVEQVRLTAGMLSQALALQASERAVERARDELARASTTGEAPLGPPIAAPQVSHLIVSVGCAIRQSLAQAELVARTPATVLLLGETGVGKEVFARAIHEMSPRHQRPMIRVNCAAIPSALIESELFGRERGAYTGAVSRQIGRFEAAHESTILLDEVAELPLEVQVKLLRVIQERVIERLGSTRSIAVDIRIIASTNRSLEQAVADKTFREDLFYRLNVFPITVPALRERIEDIPSLVWGFVQEFSQSLGKPIESISQDSMRLMQQYAWPGNVRELRNVIERAVILAPGPRLTVPMPQAMLPARQSSLANLELEHIRATLESTNWRIRGAAGAAERLGLKPTTLESRIAKLGLVRPEAARKHGAPVLVD
jgi:formate hydrogenlyase transcriptional activator